MTAEPGVRQFDHYDPEQAADPYPLLSDLRATCPVSHSMAHGGFWMATRYEDVKDVCGRPEDFSSRYTSVPTDIGLGDFRIPPLQLDPPEHSRFKKILAPVFTPGQVRQFEETTRAYVGSLLDELIPGGAFDASHDFARLVPTAVLCQVLGDPTAINSLSHMVESLLENAATDREAALAGGMEIFAYVSGLLVQKQLEPGDDVLSALLATEIDGERLSDEEVTFVGILLALAGIDTTWSTLALIILHLATHPEDQQRLRDHPELLETAREEFLRVYAPVTVAREVTRDTTLGEEKLSAGEMVMVSFPSANRDETIFDRADEVVLDRPNVKHMAFGSGIHRCLGMHFARMELRICLSEILSRVPPFQLDPSKEVTWALGQVRRPKTVPIHFGEP
jgi:cytochrome P450